MCGSENEKIGWGRVIEGTGLGELVREFMCHAEVHINVIN